MVEISFGKASRGLFIGMSSCVAVLLIAGCGSPPSGTVPVSGTVKFDGKPLDAADVTFVAEGESWAAKTDNDGHYQFANGAKPLKCRVIISKFSGSGDVVMDPALGMDAGQMAAMDSADPSGKTAAAVAEQLVPDKYSSKDKSELSFTIPLTGTQEANFDLAK